MKKKLSLAIVNALFLVSILFGYAEAGGSGITPPVLSCKYNKAHHHVVCNRIYR